MLFNDRYGMQRLYYHESKDAFYFAAEAKAILAVRPELRRIDPRGLGEFVSCGTVLENRTLFDGIDVLPPASAWVFRNGSLERKSSYFHPREWEEQETLDPESYYRELREVFSRNLPRYFNGHERIAMSLTGGLGHPDDHGLAEVSTRIPALLYLRQHVPRKPRCPCGAACGQGLRPALSGHHCRSGISVPVSPLRRACSIPHRWMRRREPCSRPLLKRKGARQSRRSE